MTADLSSDDDAWIRRFIREDRIEKGFVVPVRFLPEGFQDFVVPLEASLHEAVFRVVRVVRWIYAMPGQPQPVSVERREWSLDGEVWHGLPYEQPKPSRPYLVADPLADNEDIEAVQRLLDNGDDEPLARLVWLEASAQRYRNPRSALVMAASCAEVGMRSLLAPTVPRKTLRGLNFAGLMEKTLLRAQVVAVVTNRPPVFPTQKLRARLFRTAAQRNRAVHDGVIKLAPYEIDEVLDAAANFVWILEYLRGYSASLRHVTADVLGEIAKPSGLSPGDLLRAVM